jgi:hypothetical protein
MSARLKNQFGQYGLAIVFGLLILVWRQFEPAVLTNPWIFAMAFFYFFALPGWLLARILNFKFREPVGAMLIVMVLGASFYFLVNFLAIFSGMSLGILSKIILVFLIFLFGLAWLLDSFRPPKASPPINWREFFKIANLYFFLPLAIGLFILWWLSVKGVNLDGDPYLHLAIIRKALEGHSLASRALALTKTQLINPAYVYPVWHIFLAFLSKNLAIGPFDTWSNLIFPLTLVSFLVWYFLAKVIFGKISWAILSLSLFMIFVFYAGPGYLFSRLAVPDTLAQLILLPLGLAMALTYIFLQADKKILLVNFLLVFMLLVLHGPHYFYLVISLFFYAVVYAATFWRDRDYKVILSRFLKIFLVQLAALILVGATIELRSHALSVAILEFYKSSSGGVIFSTSFSKFGIVYKYGLLLLPLVLLFCRLRRWLFIVSTMLLVPLIYWTPLKFLFNRTLSGVFTDRLLANTSFYFLVLTIIFGAIIWLKDRFLAKLTKNVQTLLLILGIFMGFLLIILETRHHLISDLVYQIFYAKSTNVWLNLHYGWFLGLVLLLTALILIVVLIKKIKIADLEYKNHLLAFSLMAMIAFFLISPSIVNVQSQLRQPKNLTGENYFLYLVKDPAALDFIQRQIPAKSVILADATASKGLAALVDQYLAYSPGTAYEKKFGWVFKAANPDSAKAEIVSDPKWAIDYVYLADPAAEDQHFRRHPELYQLVFSGQTKIYKVIKSNETHSN